MATKIVIDGYNLIRQSDQLIDLEAMALEEGRSGLIRLLSAYKKIKPHPITVVFDGWQTDNIGTSREKVQGIDIVYSGRGEKADEVIKKMVDHMGDKIIVVTSDREIITYSERRGAVVISSAEFEMKARMTDVGINYMDEKDHSEPRSGSKKKGPSRRLSKVDRKKKVKMNKL